MGAGNVETVYSLLNNNNNNNNNNTLLRKYLVLIYLLVKLQGLICCGFHRRITRIKFLAKTICDWGVVSFLRSSKPTYTYSKLHIDLSVR